MKLIPYLKAMFSMAAGLFIWRELDWPQIIWPHLLINLTSAFVVSLFIFWIPVSSFIKKLRFRYYPVFLVIALLMGYFTPPLSPITSLEPHLSHCGKMSYTGTFYSSKDFFLDAYKDDFEAKNQLCWLRKMIQKVPDEIAEEDIVHHLSILKAKLLKPDFKYRSSLPLIALLHGQYLMKKPSSKIIAALKAKDLYFEVNFWKDQYSEHIGAREYSWLSWPFSSLVKSEFYFIEENWNQIHLSITVSE